MLNGFSLNDQLHVLGEAPVQAVLDAVGAAVDGGFEIAAAGFTLDHGVDVAVELAGLERDGLGLAHQGQAASDFADLVTVEGELVGDELGGGELGGVEDVRALQMLVEGGRAGADGGHVDG